MVPQLWGAMSLARLPPPRRLQWCLLFWTTGGLQSSSSDHVAMATQSLSGSSIVPLSDYWQKLCQMLTACWSLIINTAHSVRWIWTCLFLADVKEDPKRCMDQYKHLCQCIAVVCILWLCKTNPAGRQMTKNSACIMILVQITHLVTISVPRSFLVN